MIFFFVAIGGGIVALISFILILGQKITAPNKELQQKVYELENKVKQLERKG
ncbi:hypothetical protein [Thalassobacillus cyri]|uniref:hypothetical protein n=1 Tax=Thalassobacillus cyri TaxID=571932 RepID=UPI00159FCDE8|nr:hypothetical protein [Thalassobacillus cyri]